MNATGLELHNFVSYKKAKITFKALIYMIAGKMDDSTKSNGAGKSTIVEAIRYALHGITNSHIKNEDMIHNDKQDMQVKFSFLLEKIPYTVRRKVKRGSAPTIFIKKGEDKEVRYSVRAGQEVINKLLGANSSIFDNTSYFRQGDLDSFSKLNPKDAKDIVIKILQLDVYNQFGDKAKFNRDSIEDEIEDIQDEINSLNKAITLEMSENIESKYTKKDLNKYKAILEDLKFKKNLEELLTNSKNTILNILDKKYDLMNNKSRELEFSKNNEKQRISKLKNLTSKPTCPTCEHTLNKNEIKEIIKTITNTIHKLDKKLAPINKKLRVLTDTQEEVDNVDTAIDFAYAEVELVSKITLIGEELKRDKKDKEKIKKLKKEVTKLEKASISKESLLNRYDKLHQAFGRKGIQAYIIENVLPEIQATANSILTSLDTPIRISLNSQKDLKKGGKGETLDITVLTRYGERKYLTYSGGEKTFIDFALRMALSIILARRSNCKIETLILDEVFGELDSTNKRIVAKSLKEIAKKFNFKKILIISHSEELQENYNNILKVTFDGNCSSIKSLVGKSLATVKE